MNLADDNYPGRGGPPMEGPRLFLGSVLITLRDSSFYGAAFIAGPIGGMVALVPLGPRTLPHLWPF